MTEQEEHYVHFVECMESLNRAWVLLMDVRKAEPKSKLTAAAHEMALIEYAKPFKPSKGDHAARYKWPEPKLEGEQLELHNKIIALRDQSLAHSDLTVKDAKLYVSESEGKPIMTVISNVRDPLPDATRMIGLIEDLLGAAYIELERLDHELTKAP